MQADVMIVGGGPTGLSAALFLAERGVSVRIVEQCDGLSRHSKAFGVNPRTLSLLASTGVTERLLAQGHRVAALNIWRHGRRMFQLDLAKTDYRFPFMLIHAQARREACENGCLDWITRCGFPTRTDRKVEFQIERLSSQVE